MSDISEDAAEFRCLVPFPDQSESFVLGFEAGMIWQRMVSAETPIKNGCAYHTANRTVFSRMADAQGYDAEFEPCDDLDEWMVATFTTRSNRLRVVK